jgi:hypothetical protein
MPKCELSTRVDRSNAHHLLPLNSAFRDLSERPNNRSSCLMIPRILKCQNAEMGSTSHGMRDRWPFGTPRTGSSRFSIPTHLPHQFPNSEIATLFRDFAYREFETLGSKNHLSPLLPGPRKAEMSKFHSKDTSCFATSGFSVQSAPAPCHQDFRNVEPRYAEMSMFHTKGTSRFMTSGFSMLRSRFLVIRFPVCRTPKYRNFTLDYPFRDSGFRVTKDFGLHSKLTGPEFPK